MKMRTVERGQVWIISRAVSENVNEEMFVLTVNKAGSSWVVIPVHENLGLRTNLDILIDVYSEKFDESFETVTIIHMKTIIPEAAFFDDRKYFGKVGEDDLSRVEGQIKNFNLIMSGLAIIQNKPLNDSEESGQISALFLGVYDLCPVPPYNLDELIEYVDDYCCPLFFWQNRLLMEHIPEAAIAEPRSCYGGIFQKVASIIEIILNNKPLTFFNATAAGEASKADYVISGEIEHDGRKLEFEVVLDWDDSEKVTKIWVKGKSATFLRNKNMRMRVFFSDGEALSLGFDNENNIISRIPYRKSEICKIEINIQGQ